MQLRSGFAFSINLLANNSGTFMTFLCKCHCSIKASRVRRLNSQLFGSSQICSPCPIEVPYHSLFNFTQGINYLVFVVDMFNKMYTVEVSTSLKFLWVWLLRRMS